MRPLLIPAFVALLPACVRIERTATPALAAVPAYDAFAPPAIGDRGQFWCSFPVWRTFESLVAAAADPGAPRNHVFMTGPFEITDVRRDPSAWSCELPAAFVEICVLDGPNAGERGWLLSVGPYLGMTPPTGQPRHPQAAAGR